MGFQKGVGIGPPPIRETREHGLVAGDFLVCAEPAHGEMDQGVKPAKTLNEGREPVEAGVLGLKVRGLVGQDHVPLLRRETGVEVGGDDDARAKDADHGGSDGGIGGAPQPAAGGKGQIAQALDRAVLPQGE